MLKLYGKKNKKLTVDLSTVNELKENDKILIASNGKMKQIDQDLVNIGGDGGKENEIIDKTISGEYVNDEVTSIGSYTFIRCSNLITVSFPQVSSIGDSAFLDCFSLTTASFPQASFIGCGAFQNCYDLTTASFPQASTIGASAFQNCYDLTTASFPQASTIGSYAFQKCSNLTTASFPQASTIGASAFISCMTLTTASFPQANHIGSYAFSSCNRLTTIVFDNSSTTQGIIHTYAFRECYALISLYLLASIPYKLSLSTAFSSTPISNYTILTDGIYGSIFVRQSLYNTYIASTNWSYFSSRFVGLTDEQVEYVMEHGTHIME